MTPTAQAHEALKKKIASERRMIAALSVWIDDIVKNYRLGQRDITPDASGILSDILKRSYVKASKDMTGIDVREYKADFDFSVFADPYEDAARKMSIDISALIEGHLTKVIPEITSTATKWIQRVSALASTEQWSQRQADVALSNYLKSQRLVVATTESNWIIEGTRRSAVVSIKDPLQNSVRQVADLFKEGNIKDALKLSKQVEKLTKFPVSQGQGKLLQEISGITRSGVTTPRAQGRAVAVLEDRAEELNAATKGWQPIGDSPTRETHLEAGAQYLAEPIPINEPFIVGGSFMQYPGDDSLGASLAEIINCRCTTVYF